MSIHKLFSLSSKPYMSFFLSLFLSKSTEIKDCNILGLEDFDSSCLALAISKPNLIINTDLLIIIWNYLSLICKSEILYPPHLYHYLQILIYYNPWLRSTTRVIRCHWESSRVIKSIKRWTEIQLILAFDWDWQSKWDTFSTLAQFIATYKAFRLVLIWPLSPN